MSREVLDKLLEDSYSKYQVLFSHLSFHNHIAHHLGSLYFLGANNETLEQVYKVLCDIYDPYDESPNEINRTNWRIHLGDRHYCKAYKEFFQEQILNCEENWRKKLFQLLLENQEEPLINGIIICSVAHPIIHIGYALELNSQIVGIESLAHTAVTYNQLHKVIDKLELPKFPSKSALEIFKDIHFDDRFLTFPPLSVRSLPMIVEKSFDFIQFHYDQWNINLVDIDKSIEELFDLSVYIHGATHKPDKIEFDFFLLHLLTAIHAIRIIYSHFKDKQIILHIIMEFFYFAISIYIASNRPLIDINLIHQYKIDDHKNSWDYVIDKTLIQNFSIIRHLPKLVHSLKSAEKDYGFKNGFYLHTAIKTIDNLNGEDAWIGTSDKPEYLISRKNH